MQNSFNNVYPDGNIFISDPFYFTIDRNIFKYDKPPNLYIKILKNNEYVNLVDQDWISFDLIDSDYVL